jgi:hypothetical protein
MNTLVNCYGAWFEYMDIREKETQFFCNVRSFLMIIYLVYYIIFSWSFSTFCAKLAFFLCFEPFFLVLFHVYIHVEMLQAYQCSQIISVPFAFFHHYVDIMLFSKLPFSYRLSILGPTDLITIAASF